MCRGSMSICTIRCVAGSPQYLSYGRSRLPSRDPSDQHDVGLPLGEIAAGAEAVDRVGMVERPHGAAGHRREDGTAEPIDDREQLLVGPGAVDAGARDHERSRGAREQVGDLRDARVGRLRERSAVRRGRRHAHARLVAGRVEDRRRQLDVHRSRPARPHLAERDPHHVRDAIPREDRSAPLDDRPEHVELVLPLEGRRQRRVHDAEAVLRRDRHHRHALVPRGDHAADEIGRSRTGVADHDRHLARRLVEALGHVRAGGLVPEGHQADAVLVERREQWIDLGRGETEDEAHALVREAAREQRAAVHLGHRAPPRELAALLAHPAHCAGRFARVAER